MFLKNIIVLHQIAKQNTLIFLNELLFSGSNPLIDPTLQKSSTKNTNWTSLVAQSLRIRLPMQGTRVRALVWKDPTCRGATKPVHDNY